MKMRMKKRKLLLNWEKCKRNRERRKQKIILSEKGIEKIISKIYLKINRE